MQLFDKKLSFKVHVITLCAATMLAIAIKLEKNAEKKTAYTQEIGHNGVGGTDKADTTGVDSGLFKGIALLP